jgi:hypothetical protein
VRDGRDHDLVDRDLDLVDLTPSAQFRRGGYHGAGYPMLTRSMMKMRVSLAAMPDPA